MSRTRVNIVTRVNAASIRNEKRNGRDVIVVPSATLPDGIVMNGIRYDGDEIEKSYRTLERTPAPLGHPKVNGKYVSATDPEGLALSWIGAWNENVRRENGRVLLDKIIDVDVANQSAGGKSVLSAIEKGEPIHTSTGLLCTLEACDDGSAKSVARNILFDHDAILLDEQGAATPEQGVGMLVNKAMDGGQEIEVVNSAYTEAEHDLDWAVDMAARALEKQSRAPLLERIKSAIKEAVIGVERAAPVNNNQENDMPITDEQFKALSDTVTAMKTTQDAFAATISTSLVEAVTNAMKPVTEALTAVQNAEKAREEAELAELRTKIVNSNLMDEAGAKELTLNLARQLAKKISPKPAFGLNGTLPVVNDSGAAGFKAPAAS